DGALAEAGEALDEPLAQYGAYLVDLQLAVEPQHARYRHLALGPVHPQPGGVGAAHRVAAHAPTVRGRRARAVGAKYGSRAVPVPGWRVCGSAVCGSAVCGL